MANRTAAYEFTVQSLDDPRLAELRAHVKWLNKRMKREFLERLSLYNSYKGYYTRPTLNAYRVSIRARLGKNNPNAVKYRQLYRNGYQMIRLADGQHFDVYVHDDNEPNWKAQSLIKKSILNEVSQ